jgi:hypothetical protein
MGADNILRRCVLEHERPRILAEAHEGIVGGHYAGKATHAEGIAQAYGGQQFIGMLRTIARDVMIIVLCISIDKSIIRTRSLRNTHSQETQHLSWETL